MAHLFGREYTRQQISTRMGDISQIARIKPYRLGEGREDGVFGLDVSTGSGLHFSVLPSRGMDISMASFQGRPLAWRSATSDAHPAYFDHEGEGGRGWLRSFAGGLVTTCGLSYAGAAGVDGGQLYGLHGRISNLPATNVSWRGTWQGDEYLLQIRGVVRETTVFGENLELTRTITTALGKSVFVIADSVENLGFAPAEQMLLYHINIGWPIVSEHSYLLSPSRAVRPRDADAQDGLEEHARFQEPQSGYREKVYFHDMAPSSAGDVLTAIVNPELEVNGSQGTAVWCAYPTHSLPFFTEWKMMGQGTYVVGMEPANCSVLGRATQREAGTLQILQPGERRFHDLAIGVACGGEEIADLSRREPFAGLDSLREASAA